MPWVKLDDGFFDHPKMRAAGRNGRSLLTAALCHASAQLTDGLVHDYDLSLVAAKAEVPAKSTALRLVDVGVWHRLGHDCDRCPPCPSGAYLIHEYHVYQPSAEQERKRRRDVSEVKSRAGRLGAAARWGDGKPDSTAMANPIAQPWHSDGPEPEPLEVLSTTAAACTADQRQERLAAAAEIIGERAATRPETRNPTSMRRAVAKGVIADRHTEAYAIIAASPSITAADLAEQLEPTPPAVPEPYNISSHLLPVDDVVPWGGQHWEEGASALADIRAERGWAKPVNNPGASHA